MPKLFRYSTAALAVSHLLFLGLTNHNPVLTFMLRGKLKGTEVMKLLLQN
jgi:hypothetical protein